MKYIVNLAASVIVMVIHGFITSPILMDQGSSSAFNITMVGWLMIGAWAILAAYLVQMNPRCVAFKKHKRIS